MYRKFRGLFNQRGDVLGTSALIIVLILCMFAYLYVDLSGMWNTHRKLAISGDEALKIMTAEGGFDSSTRQLFLEMARAQGLDVSKITVTGTPKRVQQLGKVEIHATIPYTLQAFKPIGYGDITFNIPLNSSGVVSTYFREGS